MVVVLLAMLEVGQDGRSKAKSTGGTASTSGIPGGRKGRLAGPSWC